MQISLRLSKHLLGRLDRLSEARGMDRSRTLRAIISEASMTAAERAELPSEDELLTLLGDRARDGNVTAIRTLLERLQVPADEPKADPFADLDFWRDQGEGDDTIYEAGEDGSAA